MAVVIALPEGATVAEALRSDALEPAMRDGVRGFAVHGATVAGDAVLRDGDRLELLRPLQADPKEARRRRADRRRTGG
jgi:putative ubiquitin-RnfH superfamily antitoxin RatB of RatAB toxin-antitoxin module